MAWLASSNRFIYGSNVDEKVWCKKMFKRGKKAFNKVVNGTSKGSTFVEILVAISILGLIVAAVPPAIIFSTKSVFAQQEKTVSEMLARGQVEYLKICRYDIANETHEPDYTWAEMLGPDNSWDVVVTAWAIDPEAELVEGEYQRPVDGDLDRGIQQVNINIWHVGKLVLNTRCFKMYQ